MKNEMIGRCFEVLFRRSGKRNIYFPEEIEWEDYKIVGSRLPIAEFDSPIGVLEWLCDRPPSYGKARRLVKPGDLIHLCSSELDGENVMFVVAHPYVVKLLGWLKKGGRTLKSSKTNGLLLVEVDRVMPPYTG